MNAKVLLAGLTAAAFTLSVWAEEYQDLAQNSFAPQPRATLLSQLLPALLFFVGLALIAGLFLLAQMSSRKGRDARQVLEEIARARKEGRPLPPPPPGARMRFPPGKGS